MQNKILHSSLAALISVFVTSGAIAGGAIDLSLKSDAVRIEHEAVLVGSGMFLTVGGIFTEKDASQIAVGFHGVDMSSENVDWNGGLGLKGYLWNAGDSYLSVGVGGFARYAPASLNGLGVEGSFYMAPSILSFNGAESFQEMVLRVNYKIMPHARIFIGYNDASGSVESGGRKTVDSGMHLGFRFKY